MSRFSSLYSILGDMGWDYVRVRILDCGGAWYIYMVEKEGGRNARVRLVIFDIRICPLQVVSS